MAEPGPVQQPAGDAEPGAAAERPAVAEMPLSAGAESDSAAGGPLAELEDATGADMEGAERSPSSSEPEPEPSNSESGGSDGGEESGSDSDAEASSGSKRSAGSSREPGGGARGGKHPLPAPVAVGRRPAGSPSSSGDGKPARKRLNLFPKIKASERCGQCENCLNPQRKKACIEARRRQEERMAKEKAGARGSSGGGSTAAAKIPPQQPAAVAAAAAAAADPWGRELQRVLGPSGGVIRPEHALPLVKLLQSARTLNQRVALLAVLGRSTPDVLAAAVRHRALLALQAWLTDFVAAGKPGPASKLLGCLAKLPVTLEALQAPCELGRMVGKLRKDESMDAAVRDQAKALVAQWKRVVEGGGSSSAAPTRSAAAAAAAAKPVTKAPAAAAAGRPAAGAAAGKAAAAKPVALAAVGDDDMFGAADKRRASVKEAAAQQRKVQVQRIDVEATRGKAAGGEAMPTSPTAAAAAGAPGAQVSKATPARSEASKASISPFEGLSSFSAGVSMIGGASGSLMLSRIGTSYKTAADRAAEAASRVPDEPPMPKKKAGEGRRKVAWAGDDDLLAVRWFCKADPPAAAKEDADLSAPPAEAPEREASPPGFERAAKAEHLSEAQALRQHRLQEDEERVELEERLSQMVAALSWHEPPALAAAASQPDVGRGEDSTEAPAQETRRKQVPPAVYPHPSAIPFSPEDPLLPADHGLLQGPGQVPRIPLSLEEAMAMQFEQAQRAQQAQQGGAMGAPPPQQQPGMAAPQQLQQGAFQPGPGILAGPGQMPGHAQQQPLLGPGPGPGHMQPPPLQQQPVGLMMQLADGMQPLPGMLPPGSVPQGPPASGSLLGTAPIPAQQMPMSLALPQQQQQAQQQQQQQPQIMPMPPPGMQLQPALQHQHPPQQQQQAQPNVADLLAQLANSGVLSGPIALPASQPGPGPQQQQQQQALPQQAQQARPLGPPQFMPGGPLLPPGQPGQAPGILMRQPGPGLGAPPAMGPGHSGMPLSAHPQQAQQQPLQPQPPPWGHPQGSGAGGVPLPQHARPPPPPPQQQQHQPPAHNWQQQQQQQRGAHPPAQHAGGGGGGAPRDRRICKFFNTPLGCRKGRDCPFVHLTGDQGGRGPGGKRGREEENGFTGGPHRDVKQPRMWGGGPSGPHRRQ